MLTADWEIEASNIVIEGFQPQALRPGVLSFGVSSYGYDARVADEFRVCKTPEQVLNEWRAENPHRNALVPDFAIDPKNFDERLFETMTVAPGKVLTIPGNSFALATTVERFRIPRDTLAVCVGKSTYSRCGIIINVTPLEPMWEGTVTIEISNTTPFPAKIYPHEGIMQVLFFKTAGRTCDVSYADKKGRYQNQTGITLPSVPAGIKAYWDQGVDQGVSDGDRTAIHVFDDGKTLPLGSFDDMRAMFRRGDVTKTKEVISATEVGPMPAVFDLDAVNSQSVDPGHVTGLMTTITGYLPPEPMAFPPVPVDADDRD